MAFATTQSALSTLCPEDAEELFFSKTLNGLPLQGSHRLPLRQPAKTPEYSRQYSPGDPIQMLDWKVFARTDQLILREKRGEASPYIAIFIDSNDSMFWPQEQNSKFELACRLACNISYGHLLSGDQVRLILVGSTNLELRPKKVSDISNLFSDLQENNFSLHALQKWLNPQNYTPIDITYYLSDLLSPKFEEIFLHPSKNKFILHTLSSLELDWQWLEDDTCYFEESVQSKEYLGTALRENQSMKQDLVNWLTSTKKKLKQQGLHYCLLHEEAPKLFYSTMMQEFSGNRL